tara:strand:+ start:32085 stop:32453 length:369 start_codon:yes stop_codon:yes gene_type:complete
VSIDRTESRCEASAITLASRLRAVANSDRLRVLCALRESPSVRGLSIREVADACELTRFSASRHLDILACAELITVQRHGNRRMHRLCDDGFVVIEDWVIGYSIDSASATSSVACTQALSVI